MEYNRLIISDIHLGSGITQDDKLLKFLKENTFKEEIILNGDIIDYLRLKRKHYWNDTHNSILKKILKIAKTTPVKYILGNHDNFQHFKNDSFGEILILEDYKFTNIKGEKVYILHGHQFDGIMQTMKLLYILGDISYETIVKINPLINKIRQRLGFRKYWSLSQYLKNNVKNIIKFINNYEKLVAEKGRQEKVDIVIAGHIHEPKDRQINDIRYMNSGCWTEMCTCIVEKLNGEFEIINYEEIK